jgi:hypothetical protein
MKNIDKRKLIIIVCLIAVIFIVAFAGMKAVQLINAVEQVSDYNVESLRWAMIGAIGS